MFCPRPAPVFAVWNIHIIHQSLWGNLSAMKLSPGPNCDNLIANGHLSMSPNASATCNYRAGETCKIWDGHKTVLFKYPAWCKDRAISEV